MKELMKNEMTMTSLEVVELVNKLRLEEGNKKVKRHDVFLRDIRNEVDALKSLGLDNGHNFVEVEYTDKKGEKRPCYQMNKAGIMQMLNKESAYVRYKTQLYIESLENKLRHIDSYMINDPVERALAWVEEEKQRQQLRLENSQLKSQIEEYADFKELRKILESNASDYHIQPLAWSTNLVGS